MTQKYVSQPNINGVVEMWEELLKEYDEVIHIPMSSGLSNSCETAANFAQQFEGRVQVVDNRRISVTLKQSVIDAINMAKDGNDAKEIKEKIKALEDNQTSSVSISNAFSYIRLPLLHYTFTIKF